MTRSESSSVSVTRCGSGPDANDVDGTVVWIHGEHDIATRTAIAVAIARAAKLEDAAVVIDLSGVTSMDASPSRSVVAETVHPTGAAAALGTWVEVRSVRSRGATDRDAERIAAGHPPAHVVTIGVDPEGP